MQRYFQFAEKQRWDKKWKFKRREAVTRFTTGKQPKKIKYIRPKEYYAKPTPISPVKYGSSE